MWYPGRSSTARSVLGVAAMLGAILAGLSLQPAAPTLAGPARGAVNFTVVSVNPAGNSLVVQQSVDGPEITVDTTTTTKIVRRFNGASNLSELSAGDHVAITGTPSTATVITATRIQDNNIQVGYTQVNGSVEYVARDQSGVALRVTANEGSNAAFGVGWVIMVDTSPSTQIRFLNGQTGGVAQLRPGMVLTMYGFSDRVSQLILTPHNIQQILPQQARALTQAAPSDNTAR